MRLRLAEIEKIRLLAANALCQGLIVFKQSGHRNGLLVRIALIVFGISQHSTMLPAQTNGAVSKWETEIAAFETTDKAKPPPKGGLPPKANSVTGSNSQINPPANPRAPSQK